MGLKRAVTDSKTECWMESLLGFLLESLLEFLLEFLSELLLDSLLESLSRSILDSRFKIEDCAASRKSQAPNPKSQRERHLSEGALFWGRKADCSTRANGPAVRRSRCEMP
jgi:hypothetical protein